MINKFEHIVRRADGDLAASEILNEMFDDAWYLIKYDIKSLPSGRDIHIMVFQKNSGLADLETEWNIGLERDISAN